MDNHCKLGIPKGLTVLLQDGAHLAVVQHLAGLDAARSIENVRLFPASNVELEIIWHAHLAFISLKDAVNWTLGSWLGIWLGHM